MSKKTHQQTEQEAKKELEQQTDQQQNSKTSSPSIRYVDHWVVLKFVTAQEVIYRLLSATNQGDYEKWRLNSSILNITTHADSVDFHGYSGSIYRCSFKDEGLTINMAVNLELWKKSASRHGNSLDAISFRSFLQEWVTHKPRWN